MKKANRLKFVDDLTTLEKINLLLVGMSSYNVKNHVPSDVNSNNLFIRPENLKSQEYLKNIQRLTEIKKIILNEEKLNVCY